MAAPSFSGFTLVADPGTPVTSGSFIDGTAANVVVGGSDLFFNVSYSGRRSSGLVANSIYRAAFTFSTVDLTNQLLCFSIGVSAFTGIDRYAIASDAITLSGVSVALRDTSSRVRRWNLWGRNTVLPGVDLYTVFAVVLPVAIDTSSTTYESTSSNWDASAINRIEFYCKFRESVASGTTEVLVSYGNFYRAPRSTGLTISGGEIGDPANLAAIISYSLTEFPLETFKFFTLSRNKASFNVSIKIAADYFNSVGETFDWWGVGVFSGDYDIRNHLTESFTLEISPPANGTVIFNGSTITSKDKLLFESNPGTNSTIQFINSFVSRISSATFDGFYTFTSGTLEDFDEVTIDGASINRTTFTGFDSDPSIYVDSLGTNKRMTFSDMAGVIQVNLTEGDYSDWELVLDDDQIVSMNGNGGDYDFTGIRGGSVGNPIVFDEIDGEDYVITVAAAGIVAEAADPTTGGGSVTIVQPVATVTLTGLIPFSEVRVYDSSSQEIAGEEIVQGTTFEFSGTAGQDYDIEIMKLDYKYIFIENFTFPSADATLPIQQQPDREYLNP